MEEEQLITDYEVGQDNITPFGLDMHNPVFLVSGISIIGFVIVTLMFQQESAKFFAWLRPTITSNFDWFFLSAGNLFVIFALVVFVSPLCRVRLGGQDATPDFD